MIDKKGFVLENGEELPFVGFGTYLVKEEKIILDALESGYRHIDTARRYDWHCPEGMRHPPPGTFPDKQGLENRTGL